MILQALVKYYEIMANDPDCPIARVGYSTIGASSALLLSETGQLLAVLPIFQKVMRGKKEVEAPLRMIVPELAKRSVNIAPNFLYDLCPYVLGISGKDESDPDYATKRFNAFRDLNLGLLEGIKSPKARAVAAFLKTYDPIKARENPLIAANLDRLMSGNIVFKLENHEGFVHDDPEIRRTWDAMKAKNISKTVGQCLVTGIRTPIARLHPSIKGVRDAKTTGATLVGFNDPSYESYRRTQGFNAPTGEYAAFAYTTALNFLLSRDSETPKFTIGDTTVVYWAESTNKIYNNIFTTLFDPEWAALEPAEEKRDTEASQKLRAIAQNVRTGSPFDLHQILEGLEGNPDFYVLGLAPNSARVSVRFFQRDTFLAQVNRIVQHYQDLSIQREYEDQTVYLSVRRILQETVSQKASDKTPSPLMAGALMRSLFTGAPYPAALYYAILNRIRADSDDPSRFISKINYPRAAVIKAYLLRKYRNQPNSPIQEVLCMPLNEQSTYPAYLYGRLFAVLEKAQDEAIPNANATIKDRFFSSACASPVMVFPRLLRLSQHHLAKLSPGRKVNFEKLMAEIMNKLENDQNPFPAHLSIDEQGAFVLGYYHQRADFFVKRTDETIESNPPTNQFVIED